MQDNNRIDDTSRADYWTSECVNSATDFSMPAFAFAAEFWLTGDYAQTCQINGTYRYLGRPVRAVQPKEQGPAERRKKRLLFGMVQHRQQQALLRAMLRSTTTSQ